MKRFFSVFMASAVLCLSAVSCEKDVTEYKQGGQPEKKLWQYIVGYAIVKVVIGLSEGQWSKETRADGSSLESCDGLGSCSHAGIVSDGPGAGTNVSNVPTEAWDWYDYHLEGGAIIKLQDGTVVFTFEEDADTEDINRFFYSEETISLSREWVIDNEFVLESLGLTAPVVMEAGDHEVLEDPSGWPYIILSQN